MPQMRRPALRLLVLAVLTLWGGAGKAVGLGSIRVLSGLGQPLSASIVLIGDESRELGSNCVKARLESSDGVFLGTPQAGLSQSSNVPSIVLLSRQAVSEPAVKLSIDIGCASPIHRDYQILLDPPVLLPLVPEPQSSKPVVPEVPSIGSAKRDKKSLLPRVHNGHHGETEAIPISGRDVPGSSETAATGKSDRRSHAEAARTAIRINRKRQGRDVLRLSGDDLVEASRLKLSGVLSVPNAVGSKPGIDPAANEEMQVARNRFAAILRGEDPAPASRNISKGMSSPVETLQADVTQLRRENQLDQSQLNEIRQKTVSSGWLVTMGVVLLLSLLSCVWLALRLRKVQRTEPGNWWGSHEPALESPGVRDEIALRSVARVDPVAEVAVSPESVQGAGQRVDHESRNDPPKVSANASAVSIRQGGMGAGLPSLESSNSSLFSPYVGKGNALSVEEISDVTQEAEFWMSLKEPQRALDILEPQSKIEKPDSPVPWLYLLDVYSEIRDRSKYDALRERFERLFNARVPEFDEHNFENNVQSLEGYPHLVGNICELWHSNGILPYLESLLVDDRDGARAGFDLPVYRDILMLIGTARELKKPGWP